jgi:hypothetical protein
MERNRERTEIIDIQEFWDEKIMRNDSGIYR